MRESFLERLFFKIGCGSCGQSYDVAVDVLGMCRFLKEFDGDFAALFSGDQ
ncbi:MAG: hypothetical protein V3R87_05585 [Dehalococcoidia bacterium]